MAVTTHGGETGDTESIGEKVVAREKQWLSKIAEATCAGKYPVREAGVEGAARAGRVGSTNLYCVAGPGGPATKGRAAEQSARVRQPAVDGGRAGGEECAR